MDSAALRVAPRRPSAASRASTVVPATLFAPLLADRTPGRDAGRDLGEKCGLARSWGKRGTEKGGEGELASTCQARRAEDQDQHHGAGEPELA